VGGEIIILFEHMTPLLSRSS